MELDCERSLEIESKKLFTPEMGQFLQQNIHSQEISVNKHTRKFQNQTSLLEEIRLVERTTWLEIIGNFI